MKAIKYVWDCGHVWIQSETKLYLKKIKDGYVTPEEYGCPYCRSKQLRSKNIVKR